MAIEFSGFTVHGQAPPAPEKPEVPLSELDNEAIKDLTDAISRIKQGQPGSAIRNGMNALRALAAQHDLHIPY